MSRRWALVTLRAVDWERRIGRLQIALGLLLAGLTLAAYWGVWRCGFVDYDDQEYVTQNPRIRAGLTRSGLTWAFGSAELGNWHPLTWLSHMLDCELYGLKPAGHHATNLALHVANTLLLFGALVRMANLGAAREPAPASNASENSRPVSSFDGAPARRLLAAALAAGLFAVHPLHVESVAWIAERKDVLSTFFFLLTLLAYARFVEGRLRVEGRGPNAGAAAFALAPRRSALAYALALFFFACGLMSKPMVVTLPCVLLLLDWWPLRRWPGENPWRLVREKIPFFGLSAVFSVVTFVAQQQAGAVAPLSGFTLGQRVANALVSYARYLRKTFWPDDLAVFYPHPGDWPLWQVAGAAAVLVALTALAVHSGRQRPWLAVGWFWYLGTLVPVIGLVQVGMQSIADRYTYIPLIGVFLALSWTLAESTARSRSGEAVFGGVALVALGACWVVTRGQLQHWRDTEALFTHALRVTENNDVAHNSLGGVRYQQGRIEEAIAHFREAVRLRPGYADAHNNLGALLDAQGATEEAIFHLRRAIELRPDYANAHNNLGVALLRQGRREEAALEFEQALRTNPRHANALANLARLRAEAGRPEEAVSLCRRALESAPEFWEARQFLANMFAGLGRTNEAILELRAALTFAPDEPGLRNKLGALLLGVGRPAEALEHFRRALARKPDYADARSNSGLALAQLGRLDEAIAEYREALRSATNSAGVQNNLGLALAQKSRWEEAAEAFEAVLRVEPDNDGAHFNLGNVRMAQGRAAEALSHYEACARRRPDFAPGHHHLGLALSALGRLEEAAQSLEAALRLQPNSGAAHNDLGIVRARQGRFDQAAEHFERALQCGADPALAHYHLARARSGQGRFGDAVVAFRRALELRRDFADALNDLAWLLATCREARHRDGAEAVRLAQRAVELTQRRDAGKLDTLAAALAEAGRFEEAVAVGREALALAGSGAPGELLEQIRARLVYFETRRAWHELGE